MPHSTYTLDVEQLGRIAELAGHFGARINTHVCGSDRELALVELLHGHRPIAVLAAAGYSVGRGARGLGLADVGTVEVGIRADLQVVRIATLNTAPTSDPGAAIVYGSSAAVVRHTVVEGRPVMRERVLQTVGDSLSIAAPITVGCSGADDPPPEDK